MPVEQIGNALIAEAYYTASGNVATGLTVTCDVDKLENDGTYTELLTGAAATEGRNGIYFYILASGSVDAKAVYNFVFKAPGETVDQEDIVAAWTAGQTWVENVDAASSTLATSVEIAALNDITVAEVLAGIVEGTLDLQEVLRIILSFVAGATTGGNTTNPVFKSQDGLTDRIDMTVDSDGDRSSVTVDGS